MSSGDYEVRVRKNGSWSCHTRLVNAHQALALGSKLKSDSTFDAIKVIKEEFDEDSGRFRDKTIFSHFENQVSSATMPASKSIKVRDEKAAKSATVTQTTQKSGSKSLLVLVGLSFLLVANVGFAVLFADRLGLTGFNRDVNTLNTGIIETTDRIYDLPAVTTNFQAADGEKIIHIRLGLKIKNGEREKAIDARLTDVVTGLLADLNRMELKEHSGMVNIELLKTRLKNTVESISDENIDEIMLKEIVVF